ncbi:MAG: hypothetical protein ACKVXR_02240 [Planctomycetota bacterium]
MKSWLIPLSLAAVCSVLALRGTGSPAMAAAPLAVPCPNVLPHEPIVVYDINGYTLAGPLDLQMTVYGNGFARLSTTNANNGEGKSRITTVSQADADNLLILLAKHGAFELCDDPTVVSDMPMSTLTVMKPDTSVRTHTYSWWVGHGAYGPPEQVLLDFIASAFPNF